MPSRTRKRWTSAQAAGVLDELSASGLTIAAFARQRGLGAKRLRQWRARLRGSAVEQPRLVELVAAAPEPIGALRVVCPTGHVIEVRDIDLVQGLAAIVRGLREAAC